VRISWQWFDRIGLASIALVWIWSLFEHGAREAGWIERNLGWGFYVDFTVPVVATAVFVSIAALRRIARLLVR
jgi:hypothetical protein